MVQITERGMGFGIQTERGMGFGIGRKARDGRMDQRRIRSTSSLVEGNLEEEEQ